MSGTNNEWRIETDWESKTDVTGHFEKDYRKVEER